MYPDNLPRAPHVWRCPDLDHRARLFMTSVPLSRMEVEADPCDNVDVGRERVRGVECVARIPVYRNTVE